jgi:hypothetical protein
MMKYWDKLATTTALLCGLMAPAFAQTAPTPAPAPTTQTAPAAVTKTATPSVTHAKSVMATKLRKHHKAAAKKVAEVKGKTATTTAK